ncbi:MAG: rsmB [Gammaproteobacteria bacterium]|nr:rsmB [Gammaproteobacteria bacterium]
MKYNTRAIAATILVKVLEGHSLTQALQTVLKSCSYLSLADQAYVQTLSYGTLRWYEQLVLLGQALLHKPLKASDRDIYCLLLSGLYQLYHLHQADYAVLNETVEAAKQFKKPWAAGLLNATLRTVQRNPTTLFESVWRKQNNPLMHYAHPLWLAECLTTAWPRASEAIMLANNVQAPMVLRVNQRQFSQREYLDVLNKAGIAAIAQPYCAEGIVLIKPLAVNALPGFDKGSVSVQDGAGQLSVSLLDLSEAKRVLDVCAAPGGKTAHILESGRALETCIAWDRDPKRLQLVKDNLTRLQLLSTTNVVLKAQDASLLNLSEETETFDRILVDAPCSATGVIRRHPDIKVLRRSEDIAALAATQLQLLKAVWPLLSPGGRLVYATCSVLPQENDEVIQTFLSQTPTAVIIPIKTAWGIAGSFGRYILPGMAGMDGFYYAVLTKQSNVSL